MCKNEKSLVSIVNSKSLRNQKFTIAQQKALVLEYIPFIKYVAKQLTHDRRLLPDLVQEGVIGFLHSLQKYNESLNIKLSTYAAYYIKAYMYRYLRHMHIISLPEKTPRLSMLPRTIQESNEDIYIDLSQDLVEKHLLEKDVHYLLQTLNKQEKDIIAGRIFSQPAVTLKTLANKYGLSIEGVRKVEQRIYQKFRSILKGSKHS